MPSRPKKLTPPPGPFLRPTVQGGGARPTLWGVVRGMGYRTGGRVGEPDGANAPPRKPFLSAQPRRPRPHSFSSPPRLFNLRRLQAGLTQADRSPEAGPTRADHDGVIEMVGDGDAGDGCPLGRRAGS